MVVIEYCGGERQGILIIPEEVEGKGWRKMALELRELHDIAQDNTMRNSISSVPNKGKGQKEGKKHYKEAKMIKKAFQ